MVYAAEVNKKRYTFQASGSLWQDALVMQDIETEFLVGYLGKKRSLGDIPSGARNITQRYFPLKSDHDLVLTPESRRPLSGLRQIPIMICGSG